MNCETVRRLIDAYMDSELDSSKAMEVESHLVGCDGCRKALQGRQELSRAIKHAAVFAPAPERLRLNIRRETRTKPRLRFGLVTTGIAFAVGAVVVLGMWRPWASKKTIQEKILADVMAHHQQAILQTHLVDVSSTQPKVVQAWFTGKIDYSPRVPILYDAGFSLAGGRLDLVSGHTVPVLVYNGGGHKIDVFIMPSGESDALDADVNGLHVRSWNDCGLDYWAVSDASGGDLTTLHQDFLGRK